MYDLLETSRKAQKLSQDFNYLSRRYPGKIAAFSFPGNCFELQTQSKSLEVLTEHYEDLNVSQKGIRIDNLNTWDVLELEGFADCVRKALEETL